MIDQDEKQDKKSETSKEKVKKPKNIQCLEIIEYLNFILLGGARGKVTILKFDTKLNSIE